MSVTTRVERYLDDKGLEKKRIRFLCSICWNVEYSVKKIQAHMQQAHTKRLDVFLEEIR